MIIAVWFTLLDDFEMMNTTMLIRHRPIEVTTEAKNIMKYL